jgi:BirA family biotin operon repressor/biotin-[acetyl-CoA-carboxylase] ligase
LGREIIYYSKVTSTNEVARDLANHGADDGAIVLADIQSRGRGISPYGGLWLTIILRPKIPPHHAPVLTLLTGVVVAEVIQKMTGLKTTLKWPNDVRINEKKVCGILTELSAEQDLISYILVGIGLNVNLSVKKFPKELRDYATSIEIEFKKKLNRVEIGQRLLNKFEKEYLHLCENLPESIKKIVKKWRLLSDTLGRHVKIETISGTTEGLAADIESDGALLIITDNGEEERIIAGDCVYLDQ